MTVCTYITLWVNVDKVTTEEMTLQSLTYSRIKKNYYVSFANVIMSLIETYQPMQKMGPESTDFNTCPQYIQDNGEGDFSQAVMIMCSDQMEIGEVPNDFDRLFFDRPTSEVLDEDLLYVYLQLEGRHTVLFDLVSKNVTSSVCASGKIPFMLVRNLKILVFAHCWNILTISMKLLPWHPRPYLSHQIHSK